VEVSTKYHTVEKLQQYYIFIPYKFKVWVCDGDVHNCWYCSHIFYEKHKWEKLYFMLLN
jgi:hypothetical protein